MKLDECCCLGGQEPGERVPQGRRVEPIGRPRKGGRGSTAELHSEVDFFITWMLLVIVLVIRVMMMMLMMMMNYSNDLRHSSQGIGTDHALCGRDAGNEKIEGCLW